MRKFTIILLLFSSYAVFAQNSPILVKDIGNPGDQAIFHGDNVWPMGEQYQIGQTQNYLYFIDEKQVAIPIFDLNTSEKLKMLASNKKCAFLFSPDGQILRTDGTAEGTSWIENPAEIQMTEKLAEVSNDTLVFVAVHNGVPNLYLYCDAAPRLKQLTNWVIPEPIILFKTLLLRGNYVLLTKNTNSTSGKQNLYAFNLNLGVLEVLVNNVSVSYTGQEWNQKPAFVANYNNPSNPYFELIATDGSLVNTERITIGSQLSHLSIVDDNLFWKYGISDALLMSHDGQTIDTIICPSEVLLSSSLFYSYDQPFHHDGQNRLIIPFKNGNTFGFWLGNKETQTIWNTGNIKIFKILSVVNDQIFFSSKSDLGFFLLYVVDSTGVRLIGDDALRFSNSFNLLSTSKGLLARTDLGLQFPFPDWIIVNPNNLTTQRLKLWLPSNAVNGGPSPFTRFGDKKLLFQADDGTEREEYKTWITDGTTAGTHADTLPYSIPPDCSNSVFTSGDYILNRLIYCNSNKSYVVSHKEGQAKWDTILYSNKPNIDYTTIGGTIYLYTANTIWKTDGSVLGTNQLITLPGEGMDTGFFTGDSNYLYFVVVNDIQSNKSIVQYDLSTGQQTILETLPNSPDIRLSSSKNKTLFHYKITEYNSLDTISTLVVPGMVRYGIKAPLILDHTVAYNNTVYGINAYMPNHIDRYSNNEKTTFGDFHQIMHCEQRDNKLILIARSTTEGPIQLWTFDLNTHELNWVKDLTEYVDLNGYKTFKDKEKNSFFVEYNLYDMETTIWHIGPNIEEVRPVAYFKGYIEFGEPGSIAALNNSLYFWMYTPELGVELWKFTPDAPPTPYLHNAAPIIISPNPGRGDVQAQMPPQIKNFPKTELSLVNSTGQIVRSFTPDSPLVTISRQGLAAGYYTVILHQINGPIVGVGRLVWID